MTGRQRLVDGLRAVPKGMRGDAEMTRQCITGRGLRQARESPGDAVGSSPDDAAWIAQRRSLWVALSALFLDTELTPADGARIAQVMADSGLSLRELRAVYAREVAPVVSANLRMTARVWSSFDAAWLCAQIVRHLRKVSWWTRFMPERARAPGLGRSASDWQALMDQVRMKRAKAAGPGSSGR